MRCGIWKKAKRGGLAGILCVIMAAPFPVLAAPGETVQTPDQPQELPVEIEVELSTGSLKQAPLWKELIQLLKNPGAHIQDPDFPDDPNARISTNPVVRRPGFGTEMPPLKIWSPAYNFLTAQSMRLRTSDGEVSWDQPGPLFDPDEVVATDEFNVPTELRTVLGHLVACPDDPPYQPELPEGFCSGKPAGSLVVYNTSGSDLIPPDGTVVAEAAPGALADLDIPINEEDFFRDPANTTGVPPQLQPYIGRLAAEVLGKALFWDMQVGSDGVQSCGSCHFHAGADNRTRNQLNPGHLGGDLALQVRQANEDVEAGDFPFHKRIDPDVVGDGLSSGIAASDANDVMSSMGVMFKTFADIPTPGPEAFGQPVAGVAPLLPDIGEDADDPIAAFQGLRRVEPRNTPTFHGAAFNFDNFWDGRARFVFNGGSVFGQADPQQHIFVRDGNTLVGATNGHIREED